MTRLTHRLQIVLVPEQTLVATMRDLSDEIEFPMPVPSKYRVVIRLWPYQDCAIDVEAVA